jgi:hypothetical protein
MEPRSFRVGSDGAIHSVLRDQLAANPLHNLSYAQNVGYALPGFKPTISSSENVGQDSILKGWQYLSASGVSSLNVPSAGAVPATAFVGAASAFPGLNHRASSAAAASSTSAAIAAAASAAAAAAASVAFKSQTQSRPAFTLESISRPSTGPPGLDPSSDAFKRSNATQFRLYSDPAAYSQPQQNPISLHNAVADMSSRAGTHIMRAAVTAAPSSKPWADLVPGGDVGAAAASAASFQLQHTLAASQQSTIRRATIPTSEPFTSTRSGDSSDRVRISFWNYWTLSLFCFVYLFLYSCDSVFIHAFWFASSHCFFSNLM